MVTQRAERSASASVEASPVAMGSLAKALIIRRSRAHTHNSLIVSMKDCIVIIDAPIDDGQSKWVIDAAKANEEWP